jgi:hypothetical protein
MGQTIFAPVDATFERTEWQDKPAVDICTGVIPVELLDLYAKTLSVAGD